ncbi:MULTISPECIES: LacI family DNA-binding transcriptional regulator [Croceitalea]|uniref:LacI family DNA-binding transcriptional regulator n=1 Tax=Croceitalea vernalis TaxID=3075599 RepID=A0ABU3BFS3_9FLAO|nr:MULTISPECIES: LacI family DNA-binding transcriptional regulator [unclassified Croceitalea]MDT0539213.1 LacI family DNA-binding transcriptional regulator [Croceitalea sp. P059]MDT0621007.1 LacI family DNA-binding transcriptional regulator [Croceitalea sp. P007]
MSRTTLQQIAISLDISVTTVSKALRSYPDVSKETIARVKEEAKRLNYKPNAFAVNLRTQESKTIGLVIPEIVHQFFSSVVKGVIEEAEKHGYVVIILQTDQKMQIEKKRIEFLIEKQVDGILLALADETISYDHLYEVKSLDLPLVMFDKIAKLVECSKVIIDDKKAGYMATKHLIDTGCKNIAHFRGPMMSQNSIDRFLGYKKALAEHNIVFKESNVYSCLKMSFEEGQENGKKMIEKNNGIDGVFVNTDLVAVGLITQLKKMGIKVPEEISVIGFSNWFLSSITTPSLTTISQPSFSMGQLIFKLLLSEIKNRKNNIPVEFETVIMPTELIVRESTLAR